MNHRICGTLLYIGLFFFAVAANASKIVNVYAWGGEIPKETLHDFEKIYGIKVNFSTYDNNETLYAKLKATRRGIYDVIMPSGYYVERMRNQNMLLKLNPKKIPNLRNLAPLFMHSDFDPGNSYSAPIVWGITGIFYNQTHIKNPPQKWRDLWNLKWKEQLLILDDAREVFAISLLSLGYNPNDPDPVHIEAAYQNLLALVPNIRLFASESMQAIIIDEDAQIGSSWNGDANKAHQENAAISFVYPQDGFVIWSDCFAIPKNAPHPNEAYLFINYILSAEAGQKIALKSGFAITNKKALELLPKNVRENPLLYPSEAILQKAHFQRDVGEEAIRLYNHYWEKLKLAL